MPCDGSVRNFPNVPCLSFIEAHGLLDFLPAEFVPMITGFRIHSFEARNEETMSNAPHSGLHDMQPDAAPALRGEALNKDLEQLNSLLRGEISAAETYRMAIDNLSPSHPEANAGLLQEIQKEHGRTAQTIRAHIRDLGGEPSDSSGAWGAWATAVQGTLNLFGDVAALKSLKEGEEHGLNDYREAMSSLDAESVKLIQNQIIPAQERHISVLDQLMSLIKHA